MGVKKTTVATIARFRRQLEDGGVVAARGVDEIRG